MLEATTGYIQQNSEKILNVIGSFFVEPFRNSESIWIVAPLLLVIFVMQLYWGYYRKEDVGWDTITANSLVLIFCSMDLLRFLTQGNAFSINPLEHDSGISFLVIMMLIFGLLMLFVNFFRKLPKFIAHKISNVFSVNIMAYILVVIVYLGMSLDFATLIGSFIFFVFINTFFFLARKFVPSYY